MTIKAASLGRGGFSSLQQFGGNLREFAPFTFAKEDVLEKTLACHLLPEVGETVGPLVQIRLVNLENVSGEYNLGALSSPGDDGLDFVRGQVLGLVNDEECLTEAPSPDVGERSYEKLFAVHHSFKFLVLLAAWPVKGLDDIEIVHKRLEEGGHLALLVTWQEANLLIPEDDSRT